VLSEGDSRGAVLTLSEEGTLRAWPLGGGGPVTQKISRARGARWTGICSTAGSLYLASEGVKEPYPRQIGKRDANTKPLIWLHIHHELGTGLCITAIANGDRAVVPSTNCGWKKFDGFPQLGAKIPAAPSCEVRSEFFKQWGFTLGMIEREMYESDFCDGYRYATVLRDPVDYLDSIAQFEYEMMVDIHGELGETERPDYYDTVSLDMLTKVFKSGSFVPKDGNPDNFFYGWQLLDNFHIRAILGEDAYRVGPGKITSDHLKKAQERLSKFEFVKVLEPGATWDGTSKMLGWRGVLEKPANNRYGYDRYLKDGALAFLKELNVHDIALYNSFKNKVPATDADWS